MANQITVARDKIVAFWRDSTVATAAGVAGATWANVDQSIGHVFDLDSPGAVNRGRLPIARTIFASDLNDYETIEGGMTSMSFDVEVIVGGVTGKTNQEIADAIMSAGESVMRNATDDYWKITDSSSAPYIKGPMMTTLTRTFTCELTWSADNV